MAQQLTDLLFRINHDITRRFQFDYILFDALFLGLFVALLVRRERYRALRAGLVCAVLVYLIDAVIWTATGVREYELPAPWVKHPVDFMMDVSYGIVAFGWMWIAFDRRSLGDVGVWTAALFAGWLLIPMLSKLVPLADEPIVTVRHMKSQVWLQIVVVLAGYALLLALGFELRRVGYLFLVGCALSFMMEFSLYITGIRPPSLGVLAYDTLILTNQGVPYLYVLRERILPMLGRAAARRRSSA